jgi:hypothetical protein
MMKKTQTVWTNVLVKLNIITPIQKKLTVREHECPLTPWH